MTFDQYVKDHLRSPFVWGQNDCVTFAVGWLSVRTGKDWLEPYGTWDSAKEALRAMQAVGGLHDEIQRHLTRINPRLARDGDLALRGKSLMLFCGRYVVGPGKEGLVFINRSEVSCAWSY